MVQLSDKHRDSRVPPNRVTGSKRRGILVLIHLHRSTSTSSTSKSLVSGVWRLESGVYQKKSLELEETRLCDPAVLRLHGSPSVA
jgi:hypothetical protein